MSSSSYLVSAFAFEEWIGDKRVIKKMIIVIFIIKLIKYLKLYSQSN